jgi:hypothetical protein
MGSNSMLIHRWLVAGLMIALAWTVSAEPPRTLKDLVFLTREGCVNTPDMVNNLDDALTALKLSKDYAYIDIGTLPKDDTRIGYPTPTVLWKGKDIFGMPVPNPPFPEPS